MQQPQSYWQMWFVNVLGSSLSGFIGFSLAIGLWFLIFEFMNARII